MRRLTISLLLSSITFFCLLSCNPSPISPAPPSDLPYGALPIGELESTQITLESTNLLSSDLDLIDLPYLHFLVSEDDETINCHVANQTEGADGQCLTPINITGKASSIGLGVRNGAIPVRLVGANLGQIGLDQYGALEVSPYDLANPLSMTGTSNVEDAEDANTEWDTLLVYTAYMDIKAQIKQQFWTVRLAFVSQQPAEETDVQTCVDQHYLEAITQNSGLLPAGETTGTYRRGDTLLCKKTTVDETCVDADFQWLDLDTGTLISTRPANPLQNAWADQTEITCTSSEESQTLAHGYDLGIGGYDMLASLDEAFKLSAEWGGSCQKTYTYTNPTTGTVQTGNTLSANFDFDMSDSIFLNNIMDGTLTHSSDAEILTAFSLKQMYLRSLEENPETTGVEAYLSVSANLSVSQDDTLTCPDIADVDDTLLTGESCTPDGEIRVDCTHEACTPDFEQVGSTIWSSQTAGSCTTYCTKQTCDDYHGVWRTITCSPDC